jgi:hypothetical protein
VTGWVLPSFMWVSSFQSQVQAPSGASHTQWTKEKYFNCCSHVYYSIQ